MMFLKCFHQQQAAALQQETASASITEQQQHQQDAAASGSKEMQAREAAAGEQQHHPTRIQFGSNNNKCLDETAGLLSRRTRTSPNSTSCTSTSTVPA
jgi:hypothetical protein